MAKILLVDDDVNLVTILSLSLEIYDHTVTGVYCGEEALEVLKVHTVDIIFLDQMMPGMNGLETLQEIKKLVNYPPPVVLYTAFADTQLRQQAESIGVAAVVEKPTQVEYFLELISNLAEVVVN
jgi:CheY-like chemotaxis protein